MKWTLMRDEKVIAIGHVREPGPSPTAQQVNGLIKWIDDALRHPRSDTDRGVTYAAAEASRVERGDVIRCEPKEGAAVDIKVIVPGSLFSTRPYETPGY